MSSSTLQQRADALAKITEVMGKTAQNIKAEEERYQKIIKKPNYSLNDSEKSKQKIKKLTDELTLQHPETYNLAYTRWLLAHPSFPGGKIPSLPMEIKDMIATYLLTRRIKQIEDQVKNKPEIKAKVEKK